MKKYILITSFIFVLVLGGAFMLVSKNVDAITKSAYTAAWVGSGPDTTYTIRIFKGNATNPILVKKNLKTTSYSVTLPLDKMIYYYTVSAKNPFGESPQSKKVILKPILVKTSVTAPVAPATPGTDMVISPKATQEEGGTVKINPIEDSTITPTPTPAPVPAPDTNAISFLMTTADGFKPISNKELYKLIIENNLAPIEGGKGFWGYCFGIGSNSRLHKTIRGFQKQNGLVEQKTGVNNTETQTKVLKLILSKLIAEAPEDRVKINGDIITIVPLIDTGNNGASYFPGCGWGPSGPSTTTCFCNWWGPNSVNYHFCGRLPDDSATLIH